MPPSFVPYHGLCASSLTEVFIDRNWLGYVYQHFCDRLVTRHTFSQQILRCIDSTPSHEVVVIGGKVLPAFGALKSTCLGIKNKHAISSPVRYDVITGIFTHKNFSLFHLLNLLNQLALRKTSNCRTKKNLLSYIKSAALPKLTRRR
jgi:hypothetical protein